MAYSLQLHFDYTDPSSAMRLSSLLEGREDTAEHRALYQAHDEQSDLDWSVIEQDGLLYIQWTINELQSLKVSKQLTYRRVIALGINYKE